MCLPMRIAIPWPLMLADWLWYERRMQQIIQELQHYPRFCTFLQQDTPISFCPTTPRQDIPLDSWSVRSSQTCQQLARWKQPPGYCVCHGIEGYYCILPIFLDLDLRAILVFLLIVTPPRMSRYFSTTNFEQGRPEWLNRRPLRLRMNRANRRDCNGIQHVDSIHRTTGVF